MTVPKEPLDDVYLEHLAELANDMNDSHLPLRLFNETDTVGMRDRFGVAVADMGSRPMENNRYLAFDRYVRNACNALPSLIAEVRAHRARAKP